MAGSNTQIPANKGFLDKSGNVLNSWYFYLRNLGAEGTGSGVLSFNGRTGDVVSQAGDYNFSQITGSLLITQLPAFTGDVTSSPGDNVLTLKNVNPVTVGTFVNATITVNSKGLVEYAADGAAGSGSQGDPGDVQFAGSSGLFQADSGNFGYVNTGTTAQLSLGGNQPGNLIIGDGNGLLGDLSGNLTSSATATNTVFGATVVLQTSSSTGLTVNADGAVGVGTTSPDYGTAGQVLTSEGASAPPQWVTPLGPQTVTMNFSYGDVSPEFIYTLPANKYLLSAKIIMFTGFNGTGAALSIGDSGNNQRIMNTTQNDPSQTGAQYNTDIALSYGSDTAINLYITPGSGAHTGNGVVILQVQP